VLGEHPGGRPHRGQRDDRRDDEQPSAQHVQSTRVAEVWLAAAASQAPGGIPRRPNRHETAPEPVASLSTMRTSLAAALAAGLMIAAPMTSVAAASASPSDAGQTGPIGGPLLGTTGVVVQRLAGAPALPGGLDMGSWLVADADTGEVLAAKAPHERFLPASTLKTLTAVTLLPRLSPSKVQKASYADAAVDGSKVGLVTGYPYRVDTLFTAMLVVSGNDAAGALAEAAGGIPRTVALMNAEAAHLQALDTVARTPSGLDAPGESSSAYDLALIAREGLSMPAFRHYVGTVRATVPAPRGQHFQIYTHNRLLTTYRGDIGVKNGYTVAAGGTYIGAATRGGHTIIVTLMHANPDFWPQAKELLDWGFAAEGKVVPVGTLVAPVDPNARPVTENVQARPVVALGPHGSAAGGGGGGVAPWEIVALAVSAATAVVVTLRRLRRRPRLSLPPL
jgi:D-alanyl-D-alanine carboxypeptidase (penicillin-binding protein 5/6)